MTVKNKTLKTLAICYVTGVTFALSGFYSALLTVGTGQLVVSSGQPAFLMQVSAGVGPSGLTH